MKKRAVIYFAAFIQNNFACSAQDTSQGNPFITCHDLDMKIAEKEQKLIDLNREMIALQESYTQEYEKEEQKWKLQVDDYERQISSLRPGSQNICEQNCERVYLPLVD